MRDRRFVAKHRGGPLEQSDHRLLARWAADCAEHVLPFFKDGDKIAPLHHAIDTARAWSLGEVPVGKAQRASVAAHAVAREVEDAVSTAVARSAAQAVATAHFADHCLAASIYALKAVEAARRPLDVERDWQVERLPAEIRELVVSAMGSERFQRFCPVASA